MQQVYQQQTVKQHLKMYSQRLVECSSDIALNVAASFSNTQGVL
jgi:hypothetical protein